MSAEDEGEMDDLDNEHDNLLTPAMQSAISAHEWFSALRTAGFSRGEALQIVIGMLVAGNSAGAE
jgi:hypothetical protein